MADSTENIALVITGRDDGGSKVVKDSLAALQLYGRTVDATNKQAVAAFRESAQAEREYIGTLTNNTTALQKLQIATDQFEGRVARANATLRQLPAGSRQGALAFSTLALAMEGGDISARGLIRSVGTLGFALSNSIPALAAFSGEIAILTIGIGLAYEAFEKLSTADKPTAEYTERIQKLQLDGLKAERARLQAANQGIIDDINAHRNNTLLSHREAENANEENLKLQKDVGDRIVELEHQQRVERRHSAEEDAKRAQTEEASQAKQADRLEQTLHEEEQTAADARSKDATTRALTRIQRQYDAREREIARLTRLSPERRRQLSAENLSDSNAQGDAVTTAATDANIEKQKRADKALDELAAHDRQRTLEYADDVDSTQKRVLAATLRFNDELQKIADAKEATDEGRRRAREAAEAAHEAEVRRIKKDADDKATDARARAVRRSVDEVVRSQKLGAKELERIALEPVVTYLEGKAAAQGAEAIGDALTGNFAGAAGHGAAAVALTLGAREVAQIGGTGTRGGGGGGAGGGYGGDSFTPRPNGGAGGGLTVIVNTADPASPGNVLRAIAEINRAGTLDKPIPLAGGGSIHVNGAAA